MSYEVGQLDQQARIREKEESRERDRVRLENGELGAEELRQENSWFAALPLHRYRIVEIGGKKIAE